ncbi:MAG: DUF2188 domain-containing protein [Peptococcaceae bacterium]|nr:DUF2188 domain-containing protein [Peptococcaceae bacterium]
MPRKSVHVIPNNNQGGWSVKKGGAQRASVHTETKSDAIKMGRVISQRSGSELIIHGKDGKIQRADSHGKDPCPPKDQK